MKYPNELEQALSGAVAKYSYDNVDNNFTCLAKIKVENGWSDVSLINDIILTPEEVDVVYKTLIGLKTLASLIDPTWRINDDSHSTQIADNLLARIKQYQQNEHNK